MRRNALLVAATATSVLSLSAFAATVASATPVPPAPSAAWSTPAPFGSASHTTGAPQLASLPDGSIVSVYLDMTDGLVTQTHTDAGWSAPHVLAPLNVLPSTPIALSTSDDGRVIGAWTEFPQSGGVSRVAVAVRDADGNWDAPRVISTNGATARNPSVALGPHGRALVSWSEDDYSAKTALFEDGTWSGAVNVETAQTQTPAAKITTTASGMSSTGNIWTAFGNGSTVTAYQIYAGSSPSVGWRQAIDNTAGGKSLRIDGDADGNLTAAWTRINSGVFTSDTDANGSNWETPEQLSAPGASAMAPALDVASDGSSALVWSEVGSGGSVDIASTRPSADDSWTSQQLSTQSNGGNAVAAADHGVAVALTKDASGGLDFVRYVGPSDGWTAPQQIAPSSLNRSVALTGDGHVVAALSTNAQAQWLTDDVVAPALSNVEVPSIAAVGAPVAFSVSARARWASIASLRWDFGDGATGTGAAPTHAYERPGTYTVTITGEDVNGNRATETRTIKVGDTGSSSDKDAVTNTRSGAPAAPATTPGAPAATAPAGRARLLFAHRITLKTLLARRAIRTVAVAKGGTAKVDLALPAALRARLAKQRSVTVALSASYRAADGTVRTAGDTMVARAK